MLVWFWNEDQKPSSDHHPQIPGPWEPWMVPEQQRPRQWSCQAWAYSGNTVLRMPMEVLRARNAHHLLREGMIGLLAVWDGRLPTYREGITAIFQKGEQGSFYQDRTAQLYSARTHIIQIQRIRNMSHYLWIVEPRKVWKYSTLKTLALRNSINVRFSFIVSV